MPFKFDETDIEGVLRITPHIYEDDRGSYIKYYEKDIFESHGIRENFFENSEIISQRGTMRGLHYQKGISQAKLVHVVKGKIYDVAVDLRKGSKTFGHYHVEMLDESMKTAVYIPGNFAHGFMTLEENTVFSYQCLGKYEPDKCGGILWKDVTLSISWPIKDEKQLKLSEKDKSAMTFEEYCELEKEV